MFSYTLRYSGGTVVDHFRPLILGLKSFSLRGSWDLQLWFQTFGNDVTQRSGIVFLSTSTSSKIQTPRSKIQNSKIHNRNSKIQNRNSKIQNPRSKIQNSKIHNPNQDPKPKLQDPKSKTPRSKIKTTPAILGVQDRLQSQVYLIHLPFDQLQSQVYLIHLPFWGSKIGYKARCIWYTCHFGGPRSATKPGVSDTPAILGVQDRLQSQVYLIHLPFWGSKIGYKARCIWYTCHFGGPRSATKPGVSDTPAILGVRDRLQSQVYLIHLPFWGSKIGYKIKIPKSKIQNPNPKIQNPRWEDLKGLKSYAGKVWNHQFTILDLWWGHTSRYDHFRP